MGKNPTTQKKMYGASKLAQIVYSRCLADSLKEFHITSNTCEPGIVNTNLSQGVTDPNMKQNLQNGISPSDGAKTQIFLCTDEKIEGITKKNFENCEPIHKMKYILAAPSLSVAYRDWETLEVS